MKYGAIDRPLFPLNTLAVLTAALSVTAFLSASRGDPLIEYSIGNPSAEEQYIVELVNRTRKNPEAESSLLRQTTDPDLVASYTYWNVDLARFEREMAEYSPVPPLAVNAKLNAGSRVHTTDMLNNAFQGHTGSDGSNAGSRIRQQGYKWTTWRENVYASALSPLHLHAGFVVDWGIGPGGMQDPRGHREGILSSSVREIGVSRIVGTNGSVGPEVVGQVLAADGGVPFITGVVYYDLDRNGAYGIGEGVGGLTVTSPASTHFSVTADAGGYALPIASQGASTVRFESHSQTLADVAVTVSNTENVKVDHPLPYDPPVITGNEVASLNRPNSYSFTAVPGASEYDVRIFGLDETEWSEGAESGTLGKVIDGTSGLYSLSATTFAQTGSNSFHLTFPWEDDTPWEDQSFELARELQLSAQSMFGFDCRFGWVTLRSTLYAEISTDDGTSWKVFWERAGTNTSGDKQFSHYSLPLGDYSGETVRMRFRFRHHDNAYSGMRADLGVFLDNLTVSNGAEVTGAQITTIAGTLEGFTIQPDKAGVYHMAVRPRVPAALPYGEALVIDARSLPTMAIEETRPEGGDSVSVTFLVENGVFATMTLEGSSQADGGWTTDPMANLTSLGGGRHQFRTTNSAKGIHQFYRVRGTVD